MVKVGEDEFVYIIEREDGDFFIIDTRKGAKGKVLRDVDGLIINSFSKE